MFELLFLSKKYQMRILLNKCIKHLLSTINPSNALHLFETMPNLIEEESLIFNYIEDDHKVLFPCIPVNKRWDSFSKYFYFMRNILSSIGSIRIIIIIHNKYKNHIH